MFSYYGDTVLDPFLGSGTTMSAALSLGRNCIGIELSGEYANLSMNRVGGRMFSPPVELITLV
jgi:DNA modification methylase